MAKKIKCPKCSSPILVQQQHVQAGSVSCQSCNAKFRLGNNPKKQRQTPAAAEAPGLASSPLAAPLSSAHSSPQTNQLPHSLASRRRRSKPVADEPNNKKLFWIGGGIVGLLVLIGLIGGLVYLMSSDAGKAAKAEPDSETETGKVQWDGSTAVVTSATGAFKEFDDSELDVPVKIAELFNARSFVDFKVEKPHEGSTQGERANHADVSKQTPDPPQRWATMNLIESTVGKPGELASFPPNLSFSNSSFGVSINYQFEFFFVRWDMKANQLLGEPVEFAKLRVDYRNSALRLPGAIPISISHDGNLVAVADPKSDFEEVMVFGKDDQLLFKFKPYQQEAVQWVGFDSSGQLLTVGDGKLSGWSADDGTSLFHVDGGYRGPVFQLFENEILVVSAGNYCDFVNAKTGKCVNRVVSMPEELIVDVLVDYQRKYLYTLGIDPNATPESTQLRSFTLVICELASGKVRKMSFEESDGRVISDKKKNLPPRLGILGSEYIAILDGRYGYFVGNSFDGVQTDSFRPNFSFGPGKLLLISKNRANSRRRHGEPPVKRSKDFIECPRKLWGPVLKLNQPRAFRSRDLPVAVRVNGLSDKQRESAALAIARQLEEQGFQIGKDGLTLELDAKVSRDGIRLGRSKPTVRERPKNVMTVELPRVDYSWRLTDSFGFELTTSKSTAGFLARRSKYFSKKKSAPVDGFDVYEFETENSFSDVLNEIVETESGLKVDFMPAHVIVSTAADQP